MIKSFRHACVVVKDLNKSLKFYRDTLGLRVDKILTAKGKCPETALSIKDIRLTYIKMHCPDQPKKNPAVFELHYWQRPKIVPKANYNHISFTVNNIDKEYKRLHKMGVKFISKPLKTPHGKTKICFAFDPDNNLIELVEDL